MVRMRRVGDREGVEEMVIGGGSKNDADTTNATQVNDINTK